MDLKEIIIQTIKERGPVSFRDFMDMALYFPELGYYASLKPAIGKRGDFFTSPYVSGAFGAMIGRQLEEIGQQCSGKFTIVEFGAGTGLLCHDILEYLKCNSEFYQNIQYIIIEKSTALRQQSQKYLSEKVIWLDDIEMTDPFNGCILSNELFDNFPVHKISMERGTVMETFVDYSNGFFEVQQPADTSIASDIESMQLKIPEGSFTEICMDARPWYNKISGYLKKGYVISVDYGYQKEELIQHSKSQGTIRCYYQHQINREPYTRIGQQDITADVNFSVLNYWGSRSGFEFAGYVSQGRFLRALGLVPYIAGQKDTEENKRFAVNTLLNQMGNKFKVFIQRIGLPFQHLLGLNFEEPVERKSFPVIMR